MSIIHKLWRRTSRIGHIKCRMQCLAIIAAVFLSITCSAQVKPEKVSAQKTVSLADELKAYYNISTLPAYRDGSIVAQTSSYDTTGGNDDGFGGRYSYLRKNEDGSLVIFDVEGAGVLSRIWTPTPTDDTLDFYIDNDAQPAFSIKFRDLFSNKIFPFVAPLCGNELGGFYCYFPILFQKSCKIVSRGKHMQFYQIQYRLYPPGTKVKKFSPVLDDNEKAALNHIASLWNKEKRSVGDFTGANPGTIDTISSSFDLKPGETKRIFDLNSGGRIVGIELGPALDFKGVDKPVDIKITWDNEAAPAVYCPVADFFGYAFGSPSMQSLLLGSRDDTDYCYFPMPFDEKAVIELIYRDEKTTGNDPAPLHLHTRIYYTKNKRNIQTEGKFYSHWASRKEGPEAGPHVFLDTRGKGHYVGSILQAQGLQPGMTVFFEGDDSTAVDGQFRIHGTGSEDYFNGGWYALLDRWDTKMSLSLHGALDYSLPMARTGGYRLFIADKISFEKAIYQSIEHGPTDNIPVAYTSLAFYYCDSPVRTFIRPTRELTRVYMPDTLMMYPQLMKFSTGGKVSFKFEGGKLLLTGTPGSVVRISLDDIPYGRYKVLAELDKFPGGGEFSIWQRQKQLSEGVSTYSPQEERLVQFWCDIAVEDFKNTLTIRFKTNKSLSLHRLIFVKASPGQTE